MPQQRRPAYDAVIAGYLGVDLAPGFRATAPVPLGELLRPGKLIEVDPLTISLGGVVANTGLAMSLFGKRVALMGLVGDDTLGDLVLSLLSKRDADCHLRRTAAAGTAYGIVLAPPGTDRLFLECPGCNALFGADDIDCDVVAQGRLFHFGYPPLMERLVADGGAELETIFRRVKEPGVVTSLDMTLPDPDTPSGKVDWQAILARVLPFVDVFTPSIEEIAFMLAPEQYASAMARAGEGDPVDAIPEQVYRDLAGRVLNLGVKVLLLKAGHRGGYLSTGADTPPLELPTDNWTGRELWVPAFPTDPVRAKNASAAGDVAVAGFLTAMLNGETIESAGSYAMLAGRDNLYGVDALGGLRSWEEMTGELQGMPS